MLCAMQCAERLNMPSRASMFARLVRVAGTTSVLLACMTLAPAKADMFTVSYLAAGVDAANPGRTGSGALCATGGTCVIGTQTLDSPALASGTPFATDFGTNGQITGSYSGAFQIIPGDTYG